MDDLAGPIWSTQRMSGNSWVSLHPGVLISPSGDFRACPGMSVCPFLWLPSVCLPPLSPTHRHTRPEAHERPVSHPVSVCLSVSIHSPPKLAFGAYTNLLWASDVGFTFARSQLPQWVMAALYSHSGDVSPVSCEVCMGAGDICQKVGKRALNTDLSPCQCRRPGPGALRARGPSCW